MKSEKEAKTNAQEEKEWYRERIVEMVRGVEDVWILEAIHNFVVGMEK